MSITLWGCFFGLGRYLDGKILVQSLRHITQDLFTLQILLAWFLWCNWDDILDADDYWWWRCIGL